MTSYLSLILKGAAMGAANVIPGVSGGTVAFVTGIYERLINAAKAFDLDSLRMLVTGRFREFSRKVDFFFLLPVVLGVLASFLLFAWLLKKLFALEPVLVWSFFFGLILASIFYVGKRVSRWNWGAVAACAAGAAIAAGIALMKPAEQNASFWYLIVCGMAAMAAMIIPGISGSFVLLLLGNYQLIVIDSVNSLRELDFSALKVLLPVALGAVIGLASLSRLLSWIFRRHHDVAVALLTGFVVGSLLVIWPWKEARVGVQKIPAAEQTGHFLHGYYFPQLSGETLAAVALMIIGVILVWVMERYGDFESSH